MNPFWGYLWNESSQNINLLGITFDFLTSVTSSGIKFLIPPLHTVPGQHFGNDLDISIGVLWHPGPGGSWKQLKDMKTIFIIH